MIQIYNNELKCVEYNNCRIFTKYIMCVKDIVTNIQNTIGKNIYVFTVDIIIVTDCLKYKYTQSLSRT